MASIKKNLLIIIFLISGISSMTSCKTPEIKFHGEPDTTGIFDGEEKSRPKLEKCDHTSECLLAFGIENRKYPDNPPEFLKRRSLKILKVKDVAEEDIPASPVDITGAKEQLSEIERFLASFEPASGPELHLPPKPAHKSAFRKALLMSGGTGRKNDNMRETVEHATVRKLRVGEHHDYTRIVLDITGKTRFKLKIDNEEKLIYVELPDANWQAPDKWDSTRPPLLLAWLAKPDETGKGTKLIIRLKKKAKIIHEEYLPDIGHPWHRIIFDLQKIT
jgi:hypothetical protein